MPKHFTATAQGREAHLGPLYDSRPGCRNCSPQHLSSSHNQPQPRPSLCSGTCHPLYSGLGQNRLHHFAVNVGESITPTLKLERQTLVIDAEQVHHRCLEVMDVDFVLDGTHA